MPEELRFFLRTALYAGAIAAIYWFASFEPDGIPYRYDNAGTTLLVAAALAAASVVLAVVLLVRAARGEVIPPSGSAAGRAFGAVNRAIGLERGSTDRLPQPLAGWPDAIPTSSAAPVLAGVAAALVALGLVFGAWLLVPGIVLGAVAVWGWLTEVGP